MNNNELHMVVEEVRNRLSIAETIGKYVKLTARNQALCPFHEEKTPSFSVNLKGQYFHCFGCGKGGDVLKFLQLYEDKPFMQVLREQAGSLGIAMPEDTAEAQRLLEGESKKRDILQATAHFYHGNITDDARTYLIQERGLSDQTIEQFRIGFASGGLKQHLIGECGYSVDDCLAAGVLRKNREGKAKDHFWNRIVFPNLRRGQVVHMTARALGNDEPKYLHLPGEIVHLFNEDALLEKNVILAEGPVDCLTAVQAGFPAAAVLGVGQFNASHAHRFRNCETVYICMDGDDVGTTAAERIGAILADKALIVRMPDGQDINQFLHSRSKKDFEELLKAGRPYLDLEYEKIKAEPECTRISALESFLPKLTPLSPFRRAAYIDTIKKDFKISKKTIGEGIAAGTQATTSLDQPPEMPKETPLTDSEKKAAMELLGAPNLLECLNETLEAMDCVGEENNKILVYFTLTSRLSDSPINLIVKGDSSGGKSFLVEIVSRLFPQDQMLMFTALTPKALYHRKDSLAHKALIIFERPGAEESDYSIRSLQSEKKLVISASVKDPETQQWQTEDHTVEGPIAYIETTTQMHLHDENETRCFEIFIDDSEEQTKRIQEVQRRKYQHGKSGRQAEIAVWQAAQRLLRPLPVIIPYIGSIAFPTKPLRVRRDFGRFLTLIETSALLHQHQRKIDSVSGQEHIVATLEDYVAAYSLAQTALQSTIMRISPKAELLAKAIQEQVAQSGNEPLTRRQIQDIVKWEKKTITKYLDELVDQGIVEQRTNGRGNPYEYIFVRLPDRDDNLLIHPDIIRKLGLAASRPNLSKVGENSIGEVNGMPDNEMKQVVQLGRRG